MGASGKRKNVYITCYNSSCLL